MIELIISIYKANSAKDKNPHISLILENTQLINLLLRISADLKCIPLTEYAALVEKNASVAKQANGWKNFVQ